MQLCRPSSLGAIPGMLNNGTCPALAFELDQDVRNIQRICDMDGEGAGNDIKVRKVCAGVIELDRETCISRRHAKSLNEVTRVKARLGKVLNHVDPANTA